MVAELGDLALALEGRGEKPIAPLDKQFPQGIKILGNGKANGGYWGGGINSEEREMVQWGGHVRWGGSPFCLHTYRRIVVWSGHIAAKQGTARGHGDGLFAPLQLLAPLPNPLGRLCVHLFYGCLRESKTKEERHGMFPHLSPHL